MNNSPIGIFDSGSGGLTTLDACRRILPNENFVYVSDSLPGGWGSLPEPRIALRVHKCFERLLREGCKAVVAACNTATEVEIAELRREYSIPIVGLEPALRPAVRAFPDGKILVIATPAAVRQEKFKKLTAEFPDANVVVRAQPELARRIEKHINSLDCLEGEAERIVERDKPDALVLGCTHYVFLRYAFEKLLGADRVFDGNDGAAKRLSRVLSDSDLLSSSDIEGTVNFYTV